jgi:DNA-binding IclR family transcriptional regulator
MHHAHLVGQELEAGPRTVPELAAACDLTESRVEEALSHMEEGDVVAPRGERYVLLEENTGLLAFLRTVVAGLVGRVTRPFGGLG